MKTNAEIEQAYVDGAFARIVDGVHHRIGRRRHRTIAIVAGSTLLLSAASIGAAYVWPDAKGSPYISCFLSDNLDSAVSTGVGFTMTDPVGFCIDDLNYKATANAPVVSWLNTPRSDLMACRVADGVAGVFPATSGGCDSLDLTAWTPADAARAVHIRATYDNWQKATFDIPIPTLATTPHQVPNP